MKKLYSLTVAGAFLAATALPAMAIDPQPEVREAPKLPQEHTTGMQQPSTEAGTQQRVSGTVTAVQPNRGFVTLSSSDGSLKLHFPPRAIHGLKKGETITAQYAFTKAGHGATRAFDAPKSLGEHRMTGTVSKVDHEKGWLYVKTVGAPLQLRFPADQIRDLKKGDRITVNMAFSRGA